LCHNEHQCVLKVLQSGLHSLEKCAAVSCSRVPRPTKLFKSPTHAHATTPNFLFWDEWFNIFLASWCVERKLCRSCTPVFTTDRSGRSSGCSKARLLKVYGICCSLLSVLRCCAASLFLRTCFLLLLPVFFSFVGLLLGLDSLLRLAYCVVLGKNKTVTSGHN